MTLAELGTQAREFARADTTATSAARLNEYIQNAVDRFSRDVGGFPMDVNSQIAATFDTETHFAFHVKIVDSGSEVVDQDVTITDTARDDTTGSTVASDLQTALRAMTGAEGSETVTWTNFYFTIDFKQGNTSSGDSIVLSAPSGNTYTDALEILGLSAGTTTGTTEVEGDFPQDCTNYVTLPSDAIAVDRVEWDYDELVMAGLEWVQSGESQGDPTHFAVRGRRVYLTPSPDQQKRLEIWYRGSPTDIDFDTDTDVPSEIPGQYQEAIVWLTALYLARASWDMDAANICMAEYRDIMRRYRMHYANMNTAIEENYHRGYPRVGNVLARQGF